MPGSQRWRRRSGWRVAHLVGHHGEATALLAGAGSLDGGVEGQQVGLLRMLRMVSRMLPMESVWLARDSMTPATCSDLTG